MNILMQLVMLTSNYTPRKQSLGGYIGITLSVRPSMYLVSATPPNNSTCTFTKREGGGMYLVSATPTKLLIEFL